ncbi:MAG: glycoside hydrolase family 13 protein [Clostridia bacterium]|nr:glycoside hydrolase family 13 protein [Clostridia bacterium]
MSDRILHDSFDRFYRTPFGAVPEGSSVNLRLKIPVSCPVTAVFAVLEREGGSSFDYPMKEEDRDERGVTFAVSLNLPVRGLYFYRFFVEQEGNSFRLFRQGLHDTNMEAGERWQITCFPAGFSVPRKTRGAVMYQIFPDRFAVSGDVITEGKIPPFRVHVSLEEPPDVSPDENGIWNKDFYGGNFAGIRSKLGYIAGLGADVIYLNPIFMARSNHRYDTADYLRPDPMLGTERDFADLCSDAKKLGITVILDGVFSHTGSDSVYFRDAVGNPDSPYREWYQFRRYPDDYECWWDVKTLPCVNELVPSYLDFTVRGENSVVRKWMELGAGGFRLDVADELPDGFISALRERVREINSEALVIGEVWEDASNKISYGKRRGYFTEGELDGVMNYPFRKAVVGYAKGEIPAGAFADAVMSIYENYPFDALLSSMVFLSSHDTPRIRTELGGDLRKIETAVAVQAFLPGIMSVYYGDENGMEGGPDPMNRCFFREPPDGAPIREIYRKYLRLRKENAALREGELFIETEGDDLTITRKTESEAASLRITASGIAVE